MKTVQYITIALRLFASWLWWRTLHTAVLTYVVHPSMTGGAKASYFMASVYFIGGLLIWWLAPLASRLLAGTSRTNITPDTEERDLVSVVFVAVGLLCIAITGLQDLGDFVTIAAMLLTSGQGARLAETSVNIMGSVAILKILFGMLLVIKARRFAACLVEAPELGARTVK